MKKSAGAPRKDAVVGVPTKVYPPKRFKQGLPVDNPHLPEDDFKLQELLRNHAEKVLKNLDEEVTIGRGHGLGMADPITVTRRDIFHWASNMSSNRLIAQMHCIDQNTLTKYFKKELDLARALAKYRLQDRLFDVAVSGTNASIMLFAAKNYLNMTDVGLTEPLDGNVQPESEVLVHMSPSQVTALLKNATLTNTISIERDNDE